MFVSRLRNTALAVAVIVSLSDRALADQIIALSEDGDSLHRVDTSTGVVTNLSSTGVADLFGIARHPSGVLWGVVAPASTGFDVFSINEQSGQATWLRSFTSANYGCHGTVIDAAQNVVYIIAKKEPLGLRDLVRLDLSTGTATSKKFGEFAGGVSGLARAADGQIYTLFVDYEAHVTKLLRVNPAQPTASQVVGTHFGSAFDGESGTAFTRDLESGRYYAYSRADKKLFEVDVALGTAARVATVNTMEDFRAFAGSPCGGSFLTIGSGCSGSGGFVPALSGGGVPCAGSNVDLTVSQSLGGSIAILLFSPTSANIPLGMGCSLYAFPLFPVTFPLPLGGTGAGQGSITISATVPLTLGGFPIVLQSYVLDPGAPLGAAFSNGLIVTLG